MKGILWIAGLVVVVGLATLRADDSDRLLTIDHYVRVTSTVPAIAGQPAQLYVRERVLAGGALRTSSFGDRVVLFVHGAGTPAEVAFDVPYQDYSWMAFLARAGFDVFSVDMTGYGRSTRPAPMNDPCNLARDRQAGFVASPCGASYSHAAARRSALAHRVVERRPSRGRLCGTASGQGPAARRAGARVRPECRTQCGGSDARG